MEIPVSFSRERLMLLCVSKVIRILGIDPGSAATGWGVIECTGTKLTYVASGVIRARRGAEHTEKITKIFSGLGEILDSRQPDEAAIEQTFVNSNPRDALILGQARGVALLAPSLAGLPVSEYAANAVKKSVVGRGHADKAQVQAMIKYLLPQTGALSSDEADALGVAICHAHHRNLRILEAS